MVKKSRKSTKTVRRPRARQAPAVEWAYSPEAGDVASGAYFRGGLTGIDATYRNPVYAGSLQTSDIFVPPPPAANPAAAEDATAKDATAAQRNVRRAMQRVIKTLR